MTKSEIESVRSMFKNPLYYDKQDRPYTKEQLTKKCSCGRIFTVPADQSNNTSCSKCRFELEAEYAMECEDDDRRK